jgi:hypothetical protein
MKRLSITTIGLLFALLLDAGSLHAQDDARARAATHFKQGMAHATAGEYAEALSDFEAAYQLVPRSATLYNIALAQVGLGRDAAAVITVRRYLAEPRDARSAVQRRAAEELLVRLTAKTAQDTASTPVQLTVVVFPYGQVWIDGELAGSSPLIKSLPPGPHRVSGGQAAPDLARDIVLQASAPQRVVLAWAQKELAAAAEQATAQPVQPSAAP